MCRNPFIRDPSGKLLRLGPNGNLTDRAMGLPFPCGQCLPCRINKRRIWTLRLMMELSHHEKAVFVTLTYDDEHLVRNDSGLPVLEKREAQLWIKRLRKFFGVAGLRYYLAGEYGTKTHRPHYHAVIFGLGPEDLDPDWVIWDGQSGPATNTRPARFDTPLYKTWGKGIVHVGDVTRHSIQYVAGYVTKKFVKDSDGLEKEFSLSSRRPGIGAYAAEAIYQALKQAGQDGKGLGRELRVEGKKWPIGRYLMTRLEKLQGELFDSSAYVDQIYQELVNANVDGKDFIEHLTSLDDGAYKVLESKQRMFNHRDAI